MKNNLAALLASIIQLRNQNTSSINDILEKICAHCNAEAGIVWETNSKSSFLFTAAIWASQKRKYYIHDLPKYSSATGQAVLNAKSIYVPNVDRDKKVYKQTHFWKDLNLRSFISIPIQFSDGGEGAINLYSSQINPFAKKIRSELEMLASIIPDFYDSIRDRVTFNLVSRIDELIKNAQTINFVEAEEATEKIKPIFQTICQEIASTFQCFEVAIFLSDVSRNKDVYERIAFTWKPKETKGFHKADENDGLTGWILYNGISVRIPDLSIFETQREIIREEYPNITWSSGDELRFAVANKMGIDIKSDSPHQLPPMGFIGVPIKIGEQIYGVIRMCAALESPYYFGVNELKILELVATRLGQAWESFVQQILISDDISVWRKIVNETSELDLFVKRELEKHDLNIVSILDNILGTLPKLIRDAEITDVRLLNENGDLYFAAFGGSHWGMQNDPSSIEFQRKQKKFSVSKTSESAGANVYSSGETLVLDPIRVGDPYDETFIETKKLIVAPIHVGERVFGVLDIRSVNERQFQSTAKPVAELMARQLGLYCHLVKTIIEHRDMQDKQVQAYKDFVHQVRSPIYQASARSKLVINEIRLHTLSSSSVLVRNIQATNGLCNKATRVARNISLYSDLAKKVPLKFSYELLDSATLRKLLVETSADNTILHNSSKKIDIRINKQSLLILDEMEVMVDNDMLEQCVNVLLDNAMKYSYSNTTIEVYAEPTKKGNFQLIFQNQGIPINQDEAPKCKERGWRSDLAVLSAGEGQGIGLWVVDNIMKEQKGSLEITPTNSLGITTIKLVFSAQKKQQ